MTHGKSAALAAIALSTAFCTLGTPVSAGDTVHEHRAVIALQTDDFGRVETDVSDLAPGESRTVVTDNGSNIDILRTEDGFEVYLDGELIEPGLSDLDETDTEVLKTVEVTCDSEGTCDRTVWVEAGSEVGAADGATERHVIKRVIHVECDEPEQCEENIDVALSGEGDADVHIIRLHEDAEVHSTDSDHATIVIRKQHERD